jgi:pimeloyl-ACP methyl ester carboxylesterase
MDERQIDVGGQRIAYAQSDGRGRPVIFVHGNSSSARTWQQVMAGPFRQSFRCLAFDWSVRTPVMTAG